jgi:DNA-binding NarL/FixJ family response regulator
MLQQNMAVMLKARPKPAATGKARILIVDNQPMLRERLAEVVGGEPDLAVCGETGDAHYALHLIAATRPHLAIIALSLKHSHGLELLKDIHTRYPHLLVLVFSMYDESLYAERAVRAGASGFIRKDELTKEVLRAIRRVLNGDIYLSEKITATSIRQFFARSSITPGAPLEQLSDRELEVFQLIGQGRSSRQIATALHVDIKTIETYRSRIKVKLKLNNSIELVQHAALSLHTLFSSQ